TRTRILYPDTVRILISAYSDMPSLIRAVNEGQIFAFISKPWDRDYLKQIIIRAAKHYSLEKEHQDLIKETSRLNSAIENLLKEQAVFKTENEKLKEIAIVDDLTGLYNIRYLKLKLKEEYERTHRYGTSFTLIMIDLDDFKSVNDNYGHQCGDEVLKKTAQIIQRGCRNADIAGRYGGEAFLVIAVNTDTDGTAIFANRSRKALENEVINYGRSGIKITASFGVAECSKDECPGVDELIRRADESLYWAKKRGKNMVVTWEDLKRILATKQQSVFLMKKDE
ncbi:MAG: diguanylate cyclase, partial [Deltaproteobacteria bacterium]|nr:diguanylate cyclase [Deltaproteobacteria bacterium]